MSKQRQGLSERAIRAALVTHLRGQLRASDVLIEELGIEHGSARVDVALASDALVGYEIKSDFDTLDRLARQMHTYHRVFDRLTIVTTEAFVGEVEALLPNWWGIFVAKGTDNQITLSERRTASAHERQETESIAALLWRDEAYALMLELLGPVVKPKAARHEIYEVLAAQLPRTVVQERVLSTLRARQRTSTYTLPVSSCLTV